MEAIDHPHRSASSRYVMQKSNQPKIIVAAIVALLVIIVGGFAAWALNGGASAGSVIDNSKYQALTLTNGEQYFGKLQSMNRDYFKLTDVWYVQADQMTTGSTDKASTEKKLAKLGNELHGPEDMMVISKDQVLYFENLKPDGKVSKLISQSRSQ